MEPRSGLGTAVQAATERIMRLRWLHALRLKEMGSAAQSMSAFREQQGHNLDLEEASHLDSLNKLAVLAAQSPGSRRLSKQVSNLASYHLMLL